MSTNEMQNQSRCILTFINVVGFVAKVKINIITEMPANSNLST